MNIVGKTLVIINLVFALLVAGFLVLDFATRTNWKTGFDKVKAELDVARANTQTAQGTNVKLLDEKKAAETNLLALQKEFEKYKTETDERIEKAQAKAQSAAKMMESEQFKSQAILSENLRLKEEAKDLLDLVKKRDAMVRDLQDAGNKYRQEAQANEQKAKSANERSLAILERLREIERARFQEENKKATGSTASSPRSPDYQNPPSSYVKGVVDKVDADEPWKARISLGSDEGLKDGNTLLVYRTSPRPEYVGTFLLRDVDHHSAVGQLLPPMSGGPRRALKVGDEVASRLRP